MTKYKLLFSKDAIKYIEKSDRKKWLLKKLKEFSKDPFGEQFDTRKLMMEEGAFRLKLGSYRVFYRIDHEEVYIFISAVSPRGQAYK